MINQDRIERRVISDKYRPSYSDDEFALQEALRGSLSGTSELVSDYEKALCRRFESEYAVAVSSGTAAIMVALAAVGVGLGDQVALTPTCPLCTVYPVMNAGAEPLFVDTREHGFGMDIDALKAVLSTRLKALIDIPMWGYPTEVDELYAFARDARIPLILDLAHSHGTMLHGQPLSRYADLSCFSTHERKPLATGEGGFILTDNAGLAQRCRDYSRFANLNGREFGLNFKLAALPAALGRSRAGHLPSQLTVRRQNAAFIKRGLAHPAVKEVRVVPGGSPNYYSLNLRLQFSDNGKFIAYLDEHGVPSDVKRYGCRCLYEFPAVAMHKRECPQGAALLKSMTTLPVHPGLTQDDLSYMVSIINAYEGE
jgi:perosamine synthetase